MIGHERFRFATPEALHDKARTLGLELPFAKDIGPLLLPVVIAGRTVPNRLAIQPMEGADAGLDGAPGELTFRRYRRFAAGGAGLIWFEAAAVVDTGRSNAHQLLVRPSNLAALKNLVVETREAAARTSGPDPLLILQLTHAGRFAKRDGRPAPVAAQRNPYLDPLRKTNAEFPLISDAELDRLQAGFVEAAEIATEAGFDGVDLKACHGYLVGELLAARARSESRYGGPLENRARFLFETTERIKKRLPASLLAVRLGVCDGVPSPFGFGGSPDNPERPDIIKRRGRAAEVDPGAKTGVPTGSIDSVVKDDLVVANVADVGDVAGAAEVEFVVRGLRDRGLDMLNITLGIPAYKPHLGRPFDRPADGGLVPTEHPLVGIARLIEAAAAVQKKFPDLPTVGTGYSWLRAYFPHVAAGAMAAGEISFAGVGRLGFAYPDFAADLRDKGALDPRKACLACSHCSELLRAGRPAGCVVRDRGVYRLV